MYFPQRFFFEKSCSILVVVATQTPTPAAFGTTIILIPVILIVIDVLVDPLMIYRSLCNNFFLSVVDFVLFRNQVCKFFEKS